MDYKLFFHSPQGKLHSVHLHHSNLGSEAEVS